MAEHADASHGRLSKTGHADSSAALSGPVGQDSHDTINDLSSVDALDYDDSIGDVEIDADIGDNAEDAAPVRKSMSPVRLAAVAGLIMLVGLGGLVGWAGFRGHQALQARHEREVLLRVARQGAVNLTTIDWQHADADVQRILESATGTFYDDFANRSKPFIEVVKKAQSKSVGTVTEAGVESQSGDEAQVLVALSVKSSNFGDTEQEPRNWRMRISVQKLGDQVKISNVAFVP